jgi:hypothetical protein
MLIELAVVAAAGAVAAIAARVATRRRAKREAAAQLPAPPTAPADLLSIRLGDVVQHEGTTRWLRARLVLSVDASLCAVVLLAREGKSEQAVALFAPPERDVLWLERVALTMPPSPPARLEIDRRLLDRRRVMPADIACEGHEPPSWSGSATLAVYEGAERDAALVLQIAAETVVFYGARLSSDEAEVLGRVDPSSDELGTS